MSWLQVVVLAIVQGLTEFLPVSSSAHLVLVPVFFGWADQGLAFDVAMHFGTLIAVCAYFRNDVAAMIRGGFKLLGLKFGSTDAKLALALLVATIPACIVGLAFNGWIETHLRSPAVIVVSLSFYAVLMLLADRYGRRDRKFSDLTLRDAFAMGMAQALALVPGTSRSGVTLTVARSLGFDRRDAARFSFLMSVPVILLASVYEGGKLLTGDVAVAWSQIAVGVAISATVAYFSIGFFMRIVPRIGLLPFAIYRLLLAAVIVMVHY